MPTVRPHEAALILRRRALQLEEAVRSAERASLYDALRIARSLSRGPLSSAILRAMGHPYARRHPNPPLPPYIINLQTGRFLSSWRSVGPRRVKGGLQSRIVNDAPYARFLTSGTGRMIARPILQRVAQLLANDRRRNLARELKRWAR